MLSIGRVAVGSGWEYLARDLKFAASDYYAGTETPAPTRWLGSGLGQFDLSPDDEVTVEQMRLMFGMLCDWRDGRPLGRQPQRFGLPDDPDEREAVFQTRIDAAVDRAEKRYGRQLIAEEADAIELRIRGQKERIALAGLDLTYSPPKSVSLLYAGLDGDAREHVRAAMDDATEAIIEFLEAEAGGTRMGKDGVRQVDAQGWTVASFEHHTSRAGDIQLHRHLAVMNRVQTTEGVWRTLDSRAIHRAAAAAGGIGQRVLQQALSERLGVSWIKSERTGEWEIAGIPDEAIRNQSKRRTQIETSLDDSTPDWRTDQTGSQARRDAYAKRAQVATLATRDKKRDETAEDIIDRVRAELHREEGIDLASITRSACDTRTLEVFRWTPTAEANTARAALALAQARSATFRYSDLHRAVTESIPPSHLPSDPTAMRGLLERIVDQIVNDTHGVVRVNAPAAFETADELKRSDGRSMFQHRRAQDVFTTLEMLDAEQRIVAAARRHGAPVHDAATVNEHLAVTLGDATSTGQANAVRHVLLTGRQVVAIEGPAGTGKSRMMREIATLAEREGRTVIGLTSSQNAANVLATEAGIRTENLQQWLLASGSDNPDPHWQFSPGALVVLDEASMAATHTIDRVLTQLKAAGGQLVLVGDPAQLGAVDAGGVMQLVIDDAGAASLDTVRRQNAAWERAATLKLRAGDTATIDTYLDRARIHGGTRDEMTDAAISAWHTATIRGRTSLIIADSNEQAAQIAGRARQRLIDDGVIDTRRSITLYDGNHASVGDRIVTRQNNRKITINAARESPFVANRDEWLVTGIGKGGRLEVQHIAHGGTAILPPSYSRKHVELAYASTVHAAQGCTLDSAFSVVSDATTREAFYVAMTRGRSDNQAFVVCTTDPEHGPIERDDLRAVLAGIIETRSATVSATQQLRDELTASTRLDHLHAVWSDLTLADVTNTLVNHLVEQHDGFGIDQLTHSARTLHAALATGQQAETIVRAALSGDLDDAKEPDLLIAHRIRSVTPDISRPFTPWSQRTPEHDTPEAATARSVAAVIDERIDEIRTNMHASVTAGHCPAWASGNIHFDASTELADALADVAIYREFAQTEDNQPLLGDHLTTVDPHLAHLHDAAERSIAGHHIANVYTDEQVIATHTELANLLEHEPANPRAEIRHTYEALADAQRRGDRPRLEHLETRIARLEELAVERGRWWDRVQQRLTVTRFAKYTHPHIGGTAHPAPVVHRGVSPASVDLHHVRQPTIRP